MNSDSNEIRLFGKKFFERYKDEKDLFSLTINNKKYDFCDILDLSDINYNCNILVIYLSMKKDNDDLKYLFSDCNELKLIIYFNKLFNK